MVTMGIKTPFLEKQLTERAKNGDMSAVFEILAKDKKLESQVFRYIS